MKPRPEVGAIVACFNQGEFAAECVRSIEAQTYPNVRVMLVDDASTDGSGALLDPLASERVTVVHLQRNLGRALVRNEARRRLGDVDFYLIVDCDDRLSPDYLSKLIAALEGHPRAGLAYGTLHSFGELRDAEVTRWPSEKYVHADRFVENRIPGPGVLFRAEALRATEGWRVAFARTGNEDVDLWLQVVEQQWTPVWVPDAVYWYRHHRASFLSTRSEALRAEGAVRILEYHRKGVVETGGIGAFLEREVMPWLRGALRRGRWSEAMPVIRLLTRVAPLSALRTLGAYYLRRSARRT